MLDELLQPVAPGIALLPAQNGGRFPQSHCIVLRGEQQVLVDAGCGLEPLRALLARWIPDEVIVSHAHPDHVSGLWLVRELAALRGGTLVRSPREQCEMFWRLEPLSRRFAGPLAAAWREYIVAKTGVRETAADASFGDGETLDLGRGLQLVALRTPGHVEDHYVLFEPRGGVALTFDIDLTSFGPWYGHAESEIEATLASIRRVAELEPAIIVSSHKGIVRDAIPQRLRAYAAVIEQREAKLCALLRAAPRTLDELVALSPIYGGHPYAPAILRYWEGNMIAKHLQRMCARGDVLLEGERYRAAACA